MKVLTFVLFALFVEEGQAVSREGAIADYTDSWSVTLGGAYNERIVDHVETSSNSQYSSIGEIVTIPEFRISLTAFKEFMTQSKISFTASAVAGINTGKYESDKDNKSVFYEEIKGIHYGAGLDVNLNLFYYGLKIQPYAGSTLLQESGTLHLNHGGTILHTNYEYTTQTAYTHVGVRSYDAVVGLMSYIEVGTPVEMSGEYQSSANISGGEIPLSSESRFKRNSIYFALGFGAYF